MKKVQKLKKGFTLIEMLIVVAIIGVLVLIFAPSFNVFGKANGTSLNAKAKSVSNAVFQFMSDNNNAYPFAAQPVPGTSSTVALTDFTIPADLASLIGSLTAPRLTAVTDQASLGAQLLPFVYKIDTAKVGKYLKGSSIATGDYLMVVTDPQNTVYSNGIGGTEDTRRQQLDALDGTILSKVTIKDSDANYYNGVLKNK
jgi:prepilin-type N-terminal cleavage/methylation domain-containing protein